MLGARLAVQTPLHACCRPSQCVAAHLLHMPFLARCRIWDAISRSDGPQGTYPGMASPSPRPCAAGVAPQRPPSHRLVPSHHERYCAEKDGLVGLFSQT